MASSQVGATDVPQNESLSTPTHSVEDFPGQDNVSWAPPVSLSLENLENNSNANWNDSIPSMGTVELVPLGTNSELAPSLDEIEPSKLDDNPWGISGHLINVGADQSDTENRAASKGMASIDDPMMPRSVEDPILSSEQMDFNVANVKMEPLSPPRLEEEESQNNVNQSDAWQGLETIPAISVKEEPVDFTDSDYCDKNNFKETIKKKNRKKRKKKRQIMSELPLFGHRILTLQIDSLELSDQCILGNGRIDVKALKRLSPGIFRLVRKPNSVQLGLRQPSQKDPKKRGRPKKEEKDLSKRKGRKMELKKKSETVITDSSSESDSDLEIMRKKLSKPKSSMPVHVKYETALPKVSRRAVKILTDSDSEPNAKHKKRKRRDSKASSVLSSISSQQERKLSVSENDSKKRSGIEESDSDSESTTKKEKDANGDKIKNPLFALKKLIEEREALTQESQEKEPEQVKEVLVEKLFSLISTKEPKSEKNNFDPIHVKRKESPKDEEVLMVKENLCKVVSRKDESSSDDDDDDDNAISRKSPRKGGSDRRQQNL